MKNLAIIPARGGSKRIPRKNIKEFFGKPIIAYSIETAINSGLFDEVMVSTDDEEIAQIAKQYGASIPFMRSKQTANDTATTVEVLKEVELEYKKNNKIYDNICCIYATAPLIRKEQLIEGFQLLISKQLTSVFPVVAYSYPIWRGLRSIQGKFEMVWEEYSQMRSQDLDVVYHDAGQWYWYDPQKIGNTLFTKNTSGIVLSEENVQDIDTVIDWKLAEMKYELLQNP